MSELDERDEIIRRSGVDVRKCMRCGKCTATCPSLEEMDYSPHQFIYMVEKGDVAPLLESDSLYKCLSCFACVERCPRNVEPARVIEAVRDSAIRRRGSNHLRPESIPGILDEGLPQQAIVSAFRKYAK